jgi:hypothetical protein
VETIKPNVVFFDGRMCLLTGDMKDEIPWAETMPLVLTLTRMSIAQIWLDHTGHATDRIYGSKVKEWQMDVVLLLEEVEQPDEDADICVRLKFIKARRRRSDTRSDFATAMATLKGDHWQSACVANGDNTRRTKVPPQAMLFLKALSAAVKRSPDGPGRTTRDRWMAECIRRNLVEKPEDDDDRATKSRKTYAFRSALMKLQAAGKVIADGDYFTDATTRIDRFEEPL